MGRLVSGVAQEELAIRLVESLMPIARFPLYYFTFGF